MRDDECFFVDYSLLDFVPNMICTISFQVFTDKMLWKEHCLPANLELPKAPRSS